MGVGDVGPVPGRAISLRQPAGDDDGGGAVGDGKHGAVHGYGKTECDRGIQPGGDGVGVGDGARGKPGAGGVHVDGAIRGDGVRGDGVGVGDVGSMSRRAWSTRNAAGGDDGGRCRRHGV